MIQFSTKKVGNYCGNFCANLWKTGGFFLSTTFFILSLGSIALSSLERRAFAETELDPSFLYFPPGPESEFLEASDLGLSPGFCSAWNPDYGYTGPQCCAVKGQYFIQTTARTKKGKIRRYSRRACPSKRAKFSYCSDRLSFQVEYENLVKSGSVENLLKYLEGEAGFMGPQGYCASDSGFLAWGRPILETPKNRIRLRSGDRCLNFGTDRMALLAEWLSEQVIAQFPFPPPASEMVPALTEEERPFRSKGKRPASVTKKKRKIIPQEPIQLMIGNVSAPRGGCVAGPTGRRSHRSHTNGKDIDIAFLSERAVQPDRFFTQLEPEINWWFLKKVFSNPYVCIKGVYLDRRHIGKLRKYAWNDPEWLELAPFIQHFKGHRHHFHIRIGDFPGRPGCGTTEAPEDEGGDGEYSNGTSTEEGVTDEGQSAEVGGTETQEVQEAKEALEQEIDALRSRPSPIPTVE